MTLKEILKKASRDLDLPEEYITKVYKQYWKSIRSIIASLPLKEDLSLEEFNRYKTNVSVPYLGKFTCTFDKYRNKVDFYKANLDEKNKEN